MENVIRNLGDSSLQPETNYIACLNTSSQYKAPTRNFQMNKVEDSVNRTTNCKVSETVPTNCPETETWASKPRDWSEEVERVASNAENDLDSSPQHQAATESAKLSDVKRKHTLRSPQNVCNDAMKCAGIGRGKFKAKSSHLQGAEFDKRMPDGSMLCNNAETNSDLVSTHQVDTAVVESNSLSSNSPHTEEICSDTSKSGVRKNPPFQDASEGDMLPVQAHLNGAFCVQGDARARNVPVSNMDHYRDYDYKRLPNGIENFNRGYRQKHFRMNRMPNNNSNPLQYNKGFDNRNFGHRYPAPLQSNVKPYRPVKPHENHYRHHDNRRHQQQPTRAPFPVALDKVVYARNKGIYAEREFSVFDVNRNFASQTFSIHNEMSRQMSGSVSYVPQTNVAAFRTKQNNSRIVNCDKMLCNKNEPPNNAKTWPIAGMCTDSNTSTVSCHNRTVVTPVKSMVSRNCATCTSHSHEKHCPLKDENIHNQKDFHGTCESLAPDHSQTHASVSDKIENIKLNNSPDYPIHNHRIPHNNSYNTSLNNERLPAGDQVNSNYEFLPSNDVEIKNHPLDKARSCDGKDPYMREKLGFPPAHLRKDLHSSEKTDASPKVNSGNVPLSKQSSGDFCNADGTQQNVMFLGDSPYSSLSVPHSSYADAIRMSANTISKVTSCQMSNCVEVSVSKNEYQDVAHEKLHSKIEAELPSSQWVRSRLSQVDANAANLVNVNGITHQVASNSHQGVNPRPIAVSLEKPSFYNSKTGAGIHVQPPNLSSPERRMLECQYVEEQLSGVLSYKKASEKLSFLSDLTSTGEHSSAYVPVNIRTDSTFSDTSSVCSSMSGTFKGEGHCQLLKASTPPVIIMNNCGSAEGISEISFGIEMEEIMKLCGDGDFDSVGDSSMTFLPDSDFCSAKLPDMGSCEAEGVGEGETMHPSSMKVDEENILGEFVVVGNKRLLWQDRVDASKCNMPQIVDFLQESVGEGDGSAGKFYTEE